MDPAGRGMTVKDNSRQVWHSDSYQRDTGFVSKLGEGVLQWLNPVAGERILDLGCGDGVLTRRLAEAGATPLGVDASENFVEAARAAGLDARIADGHALAFEQEFDAVFSNAALHWMLEPEKVIDGVARALRSGGRFVAEFGGFGNVAAVTTAMRAVGKAMDGDVAIAGPWFYPTTTHYSALLEKGGFSVNEMVTFYRPTPLPNGIRAWLEVMRAPFFEQFGERQEEAYERVIEALEPSLRDETGTWYADYVRLRFRAIKP
jgi:trans-aconitate methyltransferase